MSFKQFDFVDLNLPTFHEKSFLINPESDFSVKAVMNNYSSLSMQYRKLNSKIRNKILLPKVNKTKSLLTLH